MKAKRTAIVIGAGIGGLSCATRLAAGGWRVIVVEQQPTVGGKLQRVQTNGYTFDRGPSTITMLDAFAGVFREAGRHIEDYVHFYPLEPMARNMFADGHIVDLTRDVAHMQAQIALFSPEDAAMYPAFMAEARVLYQIAKKYFFKQMMIGWREKLSPPLLAAMMRIRPLTTLDTLLRRYFRHPNTLALFGRYATYVGSSPYQAPAIFAMMASLEAEEGIYGVHGGTYEIVAAMEKLARELDVEIRTSLPVLNIRVLNGRATGVETTEGFLSADIVIANADALTVYSQLLEERHRPAMNNRKISTYEPSLSGFVILAGVRKQYAQLLHHTVFFPPHYEPEFHELFRKKTPLSRPTIYVCYNGLDEPEMAPPGCSNLFVLVNAPSLNGFRHWDESLQAKYGARVLSQLESAGLGGLHAQLEVQQTFTPLHLERQVGAFQGAIYGISSNNPRQTFFRPANRAAHIDNLWFVGGTTHPGGGTPIVALSGQLVAERLLSTC
jgi:phytoene desaturase